MRASVDKRRSRQVLHWLWTTAAVLAVAAIMATSGSSVAQAQIDSEGGSEGDGGDPFDGVDIIRVEEDWVLDIADPDPAADCPQIITVFGPSDPQSGTHALFELNHGTLPDFSEGGMQLQVWWADDLVGYKRQHAPTELYVALERLTYTTVSEVSGGKLNLFVQNGQSETWGSFGSTGTLSLKVSLDTARRNLNTFDTENAIRHSRVSYGANRVNKFARTEVRYYTADGLYLTDSTERVIHRLAEDEYVADLAG